MYAKPKCPAWLKILLVAIIAAELAFLGVLAAQRAGAVPGGEPASQGDAATVPVQSDGADPAASAPVADQPEASDQQAASDEPAAEPVTLTVTFAGDCTLGTDPKFDKDRNFNTRYENEGKDAAYFLKNVADLFGADDLTVVNLEGTLTDSDEQADKQYHFKGPKEYTKILSGSGVEAASVANNHTIDYGDAGYNDTIEALDADGVSAFGYERIAYQDVKGVKVALIGANTTGEPVDDDAVEELLANIGKAKSEGAQLVLVYMHWGIEREYTPQESDMRTARQAIDAGADLVVGAHPHVVQGYEVYNGRYIVYSLGNFCYGGNSNPDDKDCLIFQQTFTVTGSDVAKNDDVKFIACSVSSTSKRNDFQPTPAEGEAADRILAKMQESTDAIAEMAASLDAA